MTKARATKGRVCGSCMRFEAWKRTRKRGRCGYFPKSVRAKANASDCFMFVTNPRDVETA